MFTNNTEGHTSNGKMKIPLLDKITCCLLGLGLGLIMYEPALSLVMNGFSS